MEQGTRDRSADAEGEVYLQAMAVREAAVAEYPSIDRVRDELFSGTGEERYRFAFDALLDGIAAAR
ncbi:hypothetical protein GCM10020218_088600 [Dactylosporangium vinaceum]